MQQDIKTSNGEQPFGFCMYQLRAEAGALVAFIVTLLDKQDNQRQSF